MKLLGNRIYLEMPKKEESKLIVDENTKDALQKELLKKMSKLIVHSVGTGSAIDPDIKVGSVVLVDPSALSTKATIIPLDNGEEVMLISPFDIIQIW